MEETWKKVVVTKKQSNFEKLIEKKTNIFVLKAKVLYDKENSSNFDIIRFQA